MIRSESLSRYYGQQPAVQELSFHVRRGEVMGLLGPNGAGKSTTMKMLTCYLPPSSGHATVDGLPLDGDATAVRRKIGYLPENAPSYGELDVESHLRFIGRMQGLPDGTLADRIRAFAEVCGLVPVLKRRISELSKGFRQRVGLAAAMLHDPECLILDEPTTGLDPNQIVEIRQLIRRLGERKTVLLSSHVLPEVEAVCDRTMIIDRGRLLAIGTVKELAGSVQGGAVLDVVVKGNGDEFLDELRRRLPAVEAEEGEMEAAGGRRIRLRHKEADTPLAETAFHAAVACGGVILEMRRQQATLEDVFRRLTTSEQ